MTISSSDAICKNSYNQNSDQFDSKLITQPTTKQMSETQTDTWTNQRLLQWTTEFFTKKELDSPRLAAEVLLAAALDCQRIDLYARFNEVPVEPQLGTFRGWVKRHGAGEPVAYLVGHKEFYSLRFEVNPHVLIPRPETEHIVMAALDCVKLLKQPIRAADVGTGSGCIAVTLATQLNDTQLMAMDISPDALSVAKRNAEYHHVSNQIEFCESDLLSAIPESQTFNLIVSNPPYVGRNEVGTLEENVARYEPDVALYGGDDGTELIARLIDQSAAKLDPGGFLVFEFSPMIADKCKQLVEAHGGFDSCEIKKDFSQHERLIVARKADSQ